MNKTEEYLLSPLPQNIREQVQALHAQWRQKIAFTCLLALSAATVLTLIFMYLTEKHRRLFEALSISSLLVAAVLMVLLFHYENQLIRRYKQIPELNTQPTDPAFLANRQRKYKKAARIARIKEGALAAGSIGLVVIVPMACLVSLLLFGVAVLVERDLRRRFPRDLSTAEKLRAPVHQLSKSICCGAFAIFGISCLLMMFSQLLYSLGKSKLAALNAKAQFTYQAALALREEYWEKSIPFDAGTIIARYGDQNQYASAWKTYYTDVRPDEWYAIVCDESGSMRYVLVSKSKITQDKLRIPDEQEQRDLLGTLTRAGEAIGCYEIPPQNTEDAK